MTTLMLLMLAATMPLPDQSEAPNPPLVALRPEETKLPRRKVGPRDSGPPRKNYWPSPNRRFTRKG